MQGVWDAWKTNAYRFLAGKLDEKGPLAWGSHFKIINTDKITYGWQAGNVKGGLEDKIFRPTCNERCEIIYY
jgi:hypothetical protein